MSVKLDDGIEFSQADFGISFLDRMDVWSRALNRVFEDLDLSVEAKMERYDANENESPNSVAISEERDYLKKWETDRIRITVKRT